MASALATALAGLVVLPVAPAQAAPVDTLELNVVSARTEPNAPGGAVTKGDPVSSYKFLINVDNTGTTHQRTPANGCASTDPGYPGSCDWPSIKEIPHAPPVFASGDQGDLASLTLRDGRYLVSVLADGYKIDGEHFCIDSQAPPEPDCATPLEGPLTVEVQPNPLPDSTLRAQIFADVASTNGAIDQGEGGLPGFVGHINDTLGEVSTDVYGNPLCTTYVGEDPDTHVIAFGDLDGDGVPVVETVGGECVSDSTGMLVIPHLGSNRYTLTAIPPDGETWIQTTTLEGNHDFDTWLMEGSAGYDTELTVGGEPVPTPMFGFVPPTNTLSGGSGHIKGGVVGVKQYTPPRGGDYNFWFGLTGSKSDKPIKKPWLSLTSLQNGDQAVWVGQGDADGNFDIGGVPDGDYVLTWWDEPQNYLLNLINVTVRDGETVDMGRIPLNGWWTSYDGYIFNDLNRNGVKNAGEAGIPNFTLTLRRKENSLMDRGQTTATTDSTGYYSLESAYPLSEWNVMEAYNDSFYTTGITYQADNQPNPTTVKGAGVDVSVLPIIGLGGRLDWGVHSYDPSGANGIDPRNGGIVGSISYDTTRNELDPQYAAAEDWQPGVSDIPVELHATVDCDTNPGTPCDADGLFELAPDGSYAKGQLLNTYVSEHWERPTGCTARDADGVALVHGVDEKVLAPDQETTGECISSISQSVQFGAYPTDQGTPDANFGATVDGNYGFGDGCFNGELDATDPADPQCVGGTFQPLGAGDYLVTVDIPDDATGNPSYKVTGEEDINIGNGDQIIPQVPPPSCAGALHTVDLAGIDAQGDLELLPNGDPNPDFDGDGPNAVVNSTFLDIGGSPYEGSDKPRCDTKLVRVNNGKSVVPMFNVFTDVPLPSRLRGLIVDDINFSTDPRSTLFGEKMGVPFAPVGIYDYTNRLVTTVESDFNGTYDVLLPSTNHISCPTPSGMCANMYRFVGNDPGAPGHLNPNFNPRYRTIATEFEAMPGLIIPTDLAPTQVGVSIAAPVTGVSTPVTCPVDAATPQLFAVDQPYVDGSGSFTISGTGFGGTQGTGQVTLGGTELPTTAWSNTSITVSVPAGTSVGARQLNITADNGQRTVNGLTFHVLGAGYDPTPRPVGPGRDYATVQAALDAAFDNNGDDLVVVYPNDATGGNPRGAYYENLIMASPVKLQGVGPGGFQGTTFVPGSIIDASAFGGDTQQATDWLDKVATLTWDGNQNVNDGEGIYVLASENATTADGTARQFTSGYKASIDGFDLRGGLQKGLPGNVNELPGGPTGLPPNITTQGGAVFANAYARHLQITNNVVQNNGGGYGTIRIGTPDLAGAETNQHNENVRIADNRIIANAGSNLAGGIGIYAGADSYEVTGNDICGNFSLEYGGGLTVYGRSPGGRIHHNRVYFNSSNDEGGGIMIAGQLPADPGTLSPGSGPVDIYANEIQANIANDDGGGIRFLMAGGPGGTDQMNVYNNMIVNNISTHEGGGVSLNDAPNVRVFNNTIMKNLTTATAVTSNGQPAPAGLSTSANSTMLQETLPDGAPAFSDPLLFNNVLWDNRAGRRAGTTVEGIGLTGDSSQVDHWDLGMFDTPGSLSPTSSVVQQDAAVHAYTESPTNSGANPGVVAPYDVSVSFATWRQNPAFVDATLVTVEVPANLLGDYHLDGCPASVACNLGAGSRSGVDAPADDIDGDARPAQGGFDAGADEVGPPAPPANNDLYYSTLGNANPGGVTGPADDADIYQWDGTANSRFWDASAVGVPGNANVDGYSRVDDIHFYMSFTGNVNLPGGLTVADEDVVYNDAGTWSLWFDGSAHGLGGPIDVGATSVRDNTLYFSINNNAVPPGAGGPGDNADIYVWNADQPGNSYTRVFDASAHGVVQSANVDGLVMIDQTHFYLSFSNTNTTLGGSLTVQDEDVVFYDTGSWSVFFDGTANGLGGSAALDIDAISLTDGASVPSPPPAAGPPVMYMSPSTGSTNLPGITGSVTNDDIVAFDGTSYSMLFDSSDVMPAAVTNSSLSAFAVLNSSTVLLSFATPVNLPPLGNVPANDVVMFTGTLGENTSGPAPSTWFDGSDVGLTTVGERINGLDVLPNGDVVVSTNSGIGVPGIANGQTTGSDLFRCSGGTRGPTTACAWSWYFDGSDVGLTTQAELVNGVAVAGNGRIHLTTVGNFNVPGVSGNNRDVFVFTPSSTGATTAGSYDSALFYNGSAHGMTANNNPVGGIDLP